MPVFSRTIIMCGVLLTAVNGFAAQGAVRPSLPRTGGVVQQGDIDKIARAAQEALRNREWGNAARDYEELSKLAPAVAEYHLNLGIARYSAGHATDAVQPLRQALKLKPGLSQAHSYLGMSLGESGQCKEALSYLKQDASRVTDSHLRREIGLSGVRCAVALNQLDDAVDFIRTLNRYYPNDPEVLYRTVHLYSDLSSRASEQLLYRAPTSYQVRMLNAEALEAQGKWEDAAGEYRKILEQNPNLPGIHYRLGRLILSEPDKASSREDARKEFETELKIDPTNAAAEFILGELDFQSSKVEESIAHFSRAVQFDASFTDALLELGRALTAADRATEAIAPLETAVRLQPANPISHFRLSTAYVRIGRKEDAQREMKIYQDLSEKERREKENLQKAVSGVPAAKPQ